MSLISRSISVFNVKNKNETSGRILKEIILILCVSAFIGMLVGLPIVVVETIHGNGSIITGIVRSGLTAVVIGICASSAFVILFRTIALKPVYSFVTVFIIILAGTVGGALVNGVYSLAMILLMSCAAEVLGLLFCLYMFRSTTDLNRKLLRKQREIQTQRLS